MNVVYVEGLVQFMNVDVRIFQLEIVIVIILLLLMYVVMM